MEYDEVERRFNKSLNEEDVLLYLRDTFEFHMKNTPYWMERRCDLDEIFNGTFEDVLSNIFKNLTIDPQLLRHSWNSFLPKGYRGRVRFYQSSGTTGHRKIVPWDERYLDFLLPYLKRGLDSLYGLDRLYRDHAPRALLHGPYGWYQEEMSRLVWAYGGILYFIGTETDGLKEVLEKEPKKAFERLDPLIRYTERVLENDTINLVRTSHQLLDFFLPHRGDLEVIMLSGVGISEEKLSEIESTFENARIIPLYGNFAFGDAIGLHKKDEIRYYPNSPFTIVIPLAGDGVVGYGEEGKMGLIVARPEILVVMVEDESIRRVRPEGHFKHDGFADPRR